MTFFFQAQDNLLGSHLIAINVTYEPILFCWDKLAKLISSSLCLKYSFSESHSFEIQFGNSMFNTYLLGSGIFPPISRTMQKNSYVVR